MGKLGLSVANQKRHYAAAQKLKAELGHRVLSLGHVRKGERLDPMAVLEFRRKIEQEDYADSTIIGYLSTASVAISAAIRLRYWELPNPFSGAGDGLRINKRKRELTAQEEKAIL